MRSHHPALRAAGLLGLCATLVLAAASHAKPGGRGRDRAPVASDFGAPSIPEDGSAVVALQYRDADGDLASDCSMTSATIRFDRDCECDPGGVCSVALRGLPNANGVAGFQYDVTANRKTSNTATVTIDVLPVNDPPVATAFTHPTFATHAEEIITLPYSDPDGPGVACFVSQLVNVSETIPCQCSAGVCTVGVTGALDYSGTASFQFAISDGDRTSLAATASLGIGDGVVGMRIPGRGDWFGFSVAAFGSRFVAGAPGEADGDPRIGAAYVYEDPNGDGDWSDRVLQARLVAGDGQSGDYFGAIVAMGDGVVLALEDSESWFPALPNRLHVFADTSGNGDWAPRHVIERPVGAGHFGGGVWTGPGFDSIDIDGPRIAVGAFRDSAQTDSSGAVYVYDDPGADRDWSDAVVTRIEASDAQPGAAFGLAVALDGDVLVVGAPDHDTKHKGPSMANSGAVYVYRHDGSSWLEEARLWASDRAPGLLFGSTVDVQGDTLVASAEGEAEDGSVYVIRYDGAQWREQTRFRVRATNADPADRFGSGGVQLVGNKIFVAAPFEDGTLGDPLSNDLVQSGALYIAEDPDGDGDWSNALEHYLKPQAPPSPSGETHDFFGCSFAVIGNTLVVGAFDEDGDGALPPNDALHDSGAVYLFVDPNGDGQWADWLEHLYAK